MISVVTVVNILMLLYFHILNATTSQWTLEEVHHSEVERFLPPDHQWVKTTNQRKGPGSRGRWRSGVCPPGEFDPLTVPLLVQKDSNNSSSSSEEEDKQPNDDGDGEATLVL